LQVLVPLAEEMVEDIRQPRREMEVRGKLILEAVEAALGLMAAQQE
jgi:hypothetical protein